jgi:hypothetical protein
VNGTGDKRTIATGVTHPVEIPPGQDPASCQEPDGRKAAAQHLYQTEIHSAPRSDPTEIQQQKGRHTRLRGLACQAQRIGNDAGGILERGMKNGIAEPQVEAEHYT